MLLYCAVDFFWSRDLFISQDRGLYIEHINHNLAVMMLNISVLSFAAVVVILKKKLLYHVP